MPDVESGDGTQTRRSRGGRLTTGQPRRTYGREIEMTKVSFTFTFTFTFSSRWHRSARKGPYALLPVSQQSPQGCPPNTAGVCLVEHKSFSTLEGRMSAASGSFLHSSFLQETNAVMLWPVHVEKVPQASEHLWSVVTHHYTTKINCLARPQ